MMNTKANVLFLYAVCSTRSLTYTELECKYTTREIIRCVNVKYEYKCVAERLKYVCNGKVMRPIESYFSLDFTYALIFMQLLHITVTAIKQEMDKLKDREKWLVSGTHELELYRNTCKNEERMFFRIIFLSFFWRCGPTRGMVASFMRYLDHTQRRTIVGRTPLDE